MYRQPSQLPAGDLIMNREHACEGDTDDTILPEDNVHEVPAEDTGAASSKLQSRATQLLRELSSYIYTTTDAGLLQDIINSVSAFFAKCRAATAVWQIAASIPDVCLSR